MFVVLCLKASFVVERGKQKRAEKKGIRNLLGNDKAEREKKDFRTLANSVFLYILLILSCRRLSQIIDSRISILLSLLFGQITGNN